MTGHEKDEKSRTQQERAKRLADALRANLRRRKEQARDRRRDGEDAEGGERTPSGRERSSRPPSPEGAG